MLRVHCPRHHQDVLLGHHQILGVNGAGRDLTVRWECWCGQRGQTRPHQSRAAALALV